MDFVEVISVGNDTALVLARDKGIQKEAAVCRGIELAAGDVAVMVHTEDFMACAIVGVL